MGKSEIDTVKNSAGRRRSMAFVTFVQILCAGMAVSVTAGSGVLVRLDYAAHRSWHYTMEYHSECIFEEGGAVTAKATDIDCILDGTLSEGGDRIDIRVRDFTIESALYDDVVRGEIAAKTAETAYGLSLKDGAPSIDSLADFSTSGLPQWNLYLQLAKLLPQLPRTPVKKGSSWERNSMFPIQSVQDYVPCEVFHQYKVERISGEQDSVYISWKFKYAPMKPLADHSAVLKYMPVEGKGSGRAIIDVKNGLIVSVGVDFETPVVSMDNARVNWKETVALEYTQAE
jgi:hypothetical protein